MELGIHGFKDLLVLQRNVLGYCEVIYHPFKQRR